MSFVFDIVEATPNSFAPNPSLITMPLNGLKAGYNAYFVLDQQTDFDIGGPELESETIQYVGQNGATIIDGNYPDREITGTLIVLTTGGGTIHNVMSLLDEMDGLLQDAFNFQKSVSMNPGGSNSDGKLLFVRHSPEDAVRDPLFYVLKQGHLDRSQINNTIGVITTTLKIPFKFTASYVGYRPYKILRNLVPNGAFIYGFDGWSLLSGSSPIGTVSALSTTNNTSASTGNNPKWAYNFSEDIANEVRPDMSGGAFTVESGKDESILTKAGDVLKTRVPTYLRFNYSATPIMVVSDMFSTSIQAGTNTLSSNKGGWYLCVSAKFKHLDPALKDGSAEVYLVERDSNGTDCNDDVASVPNQAVLTYSNSDTATGWTKKTWSTWNNGQSLSLKTLNTNTFEYFALLVKGSKVLVTELAVWAVHTDSQLPLEKSFTDQYAPANITEYVSSPVNQFHSSWLFRAEGSLPSAARMEFTPTIMPVATSATIGQFYIGIRRYQNNLSNLVIADDGSDTSISSGQTYSTLYQYGSYSSNPYQIGNSPTKYKIMGVLKSSNKLGVGILDATSEPAYTLVPRPDLPELDSTAAADKLVEIGNFTYPNLSYSQYSDVPFGGVDIYFIRTANTGSGTISGIRMRYLWLLPADQYNAITSLVSGYSQTGNRTLIADSLLRSFTNWQTRHNQGLPPRLKGTANGFFVYPNGGGNHSPTQVGVIAVRNSTITPNMSDRVNVAYGYCPAFKS